MHLNKARVVSTLSLASVSLSIVRVIMIDSDSVLKRAFGLLPSTPDPQSRCLFRPQSRAASPTLRLFPLPLKRLYIGNAFG